MFIALRRLAAPFKKNERGKIVNTEEGNDRNGA